MAEATRLVLPYPVSANRYWRSFVPKGHRRAIVTLSDEAKAYKAEVRKWCLLAGMRQPLEQRVAVEYTLYPKRPQDWARRARKDPDGWADTVQSLDLDNCAKVLLDALKGLAFDDDRRVWEIHARRAEPDGEARVEVVITPLEAVKAQAELFAASG